MKKIAITVQWLIEWGGGIDLSRHIIQGLVETDNILYIFIPEKELPRKNFLYKSLRFLNRNIPFFSTRDVSAEQHFTEFRNNVTIVHYRRNFLRSYIKKFEIDIILPCARPLNTPDQYPWVGYLPDCQHKYLNYLFTKKEIQERDKLFQEMVNTKKMILVNSLDTKKDLIKLYAADPDLIHSLPFCPTTNLNWLERNNLDLDAYSLPEKYFMISNQFWEHKDHITAFRAIASLKNENVKIVCSGKMNDYRDSTFVDTLLKEVRRLGIEDKVHFLGFIPKIDQIEILKKSLAIIQPTLFEGGPGGGCVHDGIALGIPCILSDIDINREVNGPNVFFFKAGQPDDLAIVLDNFLKTDIEKPNLTMLEQKHEKNLSLRVNSLNQLITKALQ